MSAHVHVHTKTFSLARVSFLCTWDSCYLKIAFILLSLWTLFAFHIYYMPCIPDWRAPWGFTQFTHFQGFIFNHDLFHNYSNIVIMFWINQYSRIRFLIRIKFDVASKKTNPLDWTHTHILISILLNYTTPTTFFFYSLYVCFFFHLP